MLIDRYLYPKLVDKYIDQIRIEDTDYVLIDDSIGPDAAMILLKIPIEMLKEFQRINYKEGLPDPIEFWEKTELVRRLRSDEPSLVGHADLRDILKWLDGTNLSAEYQELNSSEKIRLMVTEIPKEYPEAKSLWDYLDSKGI